MKYLILLISLVFSVSIHAETEITPFVQIANVKVNSCSGDCALTNKVVENPIGILFSRNIYTGPVNVNADLFLSSGPGAAIKLSKPIGSSILSIGGGYYFNGVSFDYVDLEGNKTVNDYQLNPFLSLGYQYKKFFVQYMYNISDKYNLNYDEVTVVGTPNTVVNRSATIDASKSYLWVGYHLYF